MNELDETLDKMPDADLVALRGQVGAVLQERIDGILLGRRALVQAEAGRTLRVQRRGRMNNTESAYQAHTLANPRVVACVFEPIKFRLATGAWYTPDFMVVFEDADANIELHEVKGFWREAARVRIKVAAEIYPYFNFRAVRKIRKKDGGGWHLETFQ